MSATIYVLQSRERKSRIIVDWLRVNRPDVDADIASRMSQYGRNCCTELAGIHADPPHRWKSVSPETWERVIARLRHPTRIATGPGSGPGTATTRPSP